MDVPTDIQRGSGSTKFYSYWSPGIHLRNKTVILDAIKLGIAVYRTDKITGKIEQFDYASQRFAGVQK